MLYSSNKKKPTKIFIWIAAYFAFSKYKVIAVMTSEVGHTAMSTLLHVYAFLYVSWYIFISKVAAMFIVGCNNNKNNCPSNQ